MFFLHALNPMCSGTNFGTWFGRSHPTNFFPTYICIQMRMRYLRCPEGSEICITDNGARKRGLFMALMYCVLDIFCALEVMIDRFTPTVIYIYIYIYGTWEAHLVLGQWPCDREICWPLGVGFHWGFLSDCVD